MYTPILIFPSLLKSNSANGQLERHFLSGLDSNVFDPYIFCYKGDIDSSTLPEYNYYVIKKKKYEIIIEAIIHRLGVAKYFNIPDLSRFFFNYKAKRMLSKLCETRRIDYVHTISLPSSTHLLGYYLATKYNIPWIAQFYDPWVDNPHREIASFFESYDKKLEAKVAHNANAILLDSDLFVKSWERRYNKAIRSHILKFPLATSISLEAINESKKNTFPIVFSHIGNLYEKRMSLDFIIALYNYIELHPQDRDCIHVNYIGTITEKEKNLIKKYGLDNVFSLVGHISEEECEKYYKSTDIFIAIDVNIPENVFFPSKIMRYFLHRKPILGITSNISVLKDELSNSGHKSYIFGDIVGIEEYIYDAIHNFSSLSEFDEEYGEMYKIENVVQKYYEVITAITNK